MTTETTTAETSKEVDEAEQVTEEQETEQTELDLLREKLDQVNRRQAEIDRQNNRCLVAAMTVSDCETALKDAKNELKEAEANYASSVKRLRAIISDHNAGQNRLPFPDEDGCTGEADDKASPVASTNWGKGSVAVLATHGLSETICEKLLQKCETIADLRDLIASDDWWHKRIKGICPQKIDAITDALNCYYQANPVEEASTEAAEDDDAESEEAADDDA